MKYVEITTLHVCQVCEGSKLPSTISDQVSHDNKIRQLPRNPVKCTVAPCQYPRTEQWARNTKMKIATIAQNGINREWVPLHRPICVFALAYNACLNFTATIRGLQDNCTRTSMESNCISSMCMGKLTLKPHVEYITAVNYRKLTKQKRLCLRTSAMTSNYVS